MPRLSPEEIKKIFEASDDFDVLFETFEEALDQGIEDMQLYQLLFWNHSLAPDEICLFGEKLARHAPRLAYDVYFFLGNVFEVTYAMFDNFKLAMDYYMKAAAVRPYETDPYIRAADCYDQDLNIPAIDSLVEFLRLGEDLVADPKPLYQRLAYLYGIAGNHERSDYYRLKSGENPDEPPQSSLPT